jgi:hypothetical protein
MNQRFDIYRNIHMALRACMADTLLAVGRMDPEDEAERAPVLARVRFLIALCQMHLAKEDRFVHPAMEARAPGSARHTLSDHGHHAESFVNLESDVAAVENALPGKREAAAFALYRNLALFVGENFVHMNVEETDNNAVLWRTHSDPEIIAIEQAIIAAVPPDMKGAVLRWMLPALSPASRAHLFQVMGPTLPPEVLKAILAMLKSELSATNWQKLTQAMETRPIAA